MLVLELKGEKNEQKKNFYFKHNYFINNFKYFIGNAFIYTASNVFKGV